MKVTDWMGRDILVPCNSEEVWKRVEQVTGGMPIEGWSFDTWTKELSVTCDCGIGVASTGYKYCKTFVVDISDLITGKMEVLSGGYKGEVNNGGFE